MGRPATIALVAALSLLPVGAAAPQDSGTDIVGPPPPVEWPLPDSKGAPRPFAKRPVAVGVAAGLAAVAVYYAMRRRHRGQRPAVPEPEALDTFARGADALGDADFYAGLMAVVRGELAAGADAPAQQTAETGAEGSVRARRAQSLTPRDLAGEGVLSTADAPTAARWRALCLRAELAQYAAARVDPADRRSDLALAAEAVARLRATRRREATT